jgi:hypothetical protein
VKTPLTAYVTVVTYASWSVCGQRLEKNSLGIYCPKTVPFLCHFCATNRFFSSDVKRTASKTQPKPNRFPTGNRGVGLALRSSQSRNAHPDQKATCPTNDRLGNQFTYGSATMSTHRCGLLTMWAADPRVPINHGEASSKHSQPGTAGYYIGDNAANRIGLKFCPFCGESITGSQPRTRPKRSVKAQKWVKPPVCCQHLDQITSLPNSPVGYRSQLYYIKGQAPLARLFYCPDCGRKLLTPGRDTRFYKKSSAELNDLKTRSQGITTIDDAITKLGPPDFDHGPSTVCLYLGGEPNYSTSVRTIFYTELAKTIMITIYEGLNGKVTVTFPPKQRNVNYKQVPKPTDNP